MKLVEEHEASGGKFKRPTTGSLDDGPQSTSDQIVGNTEEALSQRTLAATSVRRA
ncbi:MAG TPA: hypothetical protein VK752_12860 [Bryobacteraceae bacterium]|nr:hypothetical protein [Bryobacteraceae bacterium]